MPISTISTPVEQWLLAAPSFVESPESIVGRSLPYTDEPTRDSGLYFIIHDNRIQYVGISTNLSWRLAQHWGRWRFDAYTTIEGVPEMFLSDLEEFYIAWLKPQANARVRYTHLTSLLRKADAGEFGEVSPWVLRAEDCVMWCSRGSVDRVTSEKSDRVLQTHGKM